MTYYKLTRLAQSLRPICIGLLLLTLGLSFNTPSAKAESIANSAKNYKPAEPFKPQYHPKLDIKPAPGKITIDGDLSDLGWQNAKAATNFTEHSPGNEVLPPVRTEVFVTYDNENLYLSAICYADPATVRATHCERENLGADDNIGFFFDTYGDASRAYILNVTPYGQQYDALWSAGRGEDGNFDFIFKSSGIITDSGYQVEIAVPFSSLRFPSKAVQEWKFDFYRHHKREMHYSMSWATYDKDESCWPCQWGSINGIENVTPGKGIELLPSFVSHQSSSLQANSDSSISFNNGDFFGDLSLGGKYSLSSDVIVEATYNPDFSQIEADASQINVNQSFALFFNEVRPFFQEGTDLFLTNFNAVYTRSINDPKFAAKLSGRFGRTSIAAFSAQDENTASIIPSAESSRFIFSNKSVTNMFAVRRSFGQSSHLRAIVTDRRFDGGGSGSLVSFDGTMRVSKAIQLKAQHMYTYTDEPNDVSLPATSGFATFDNGKYTSLFDGESFSGAGSLVGLNYDTRKGYVNVRAYQRTPTFRAENGFQAQNDDRRIIGDFGYNIRPEGTIFHRISPGLNSARIWNFDGVKKDEWVALQLGLDFRKAQGRIWTEYLVNREQYAGVQYNNLWKYVLYNNATISQALSLGSQISYGNQIARRQFKLGRETVLEAWANLRPTSRLLIQPSIVHQKSHELNTNEDLYRGYVARARFSYQFSRELSARLVTEYVDFDNSPSSWSVDPLITYRINPFSTFFVGSTFDYSDRNTNLPTDKQYNSALTARQFFLKIQYLFQA